MTETKRFLTIEALNDADKSFGTGPEYYKNEFCWFTFIGTDTYESEYTFPNYYYRGYNKDTGEYKFSNNLGYELVIRRNESGDIELERNGAFSLILTVNDIRLTETNDTRHEIRHRQMTGGKRRKRKRRTKKRTKKRRYL